MTPTPDPASTGTADRAELARLAAAATRGPWEAHGTRVRARDERGPFTVADTAYGDGFEADAAFIVAACNAVPALLADIERLEGALRRIWKLASPTDENNTEAIFEEVDAALATGASVPADSGEKP